MDLNFTRVCIFLSFSVSTVLFPLFIVQLCCMQVWQSLTCVDIAIIVQNSGLLSLSFLLLCGPFAGREFFLIGGVIMEGGCQSSSVLA